MVSRIILLDRNAVDAVKRCVSGGHVDSRRRKQLRNLDNPRNIISPILSAIEGQSGRKETEEEIKRTLKKEVCAVGIFFNRARTDSDFFLSEENSDYFSAVFGHNIEHSWESYISFVKAVFPLLFQPVSSKKMILVEDQLFELARRFSVKTTHPVFVMSLATLYQHEGARKVLKAKRLYDTQEQLERAAYNVVSDLIVISRIGNIRAAIPDDEKRFGSVRLFTFDKGLLSVVNATTINWVKNIADGGVSINCSYSEKLFPYLDNSYFQRLTERLNATT